MICQSAGFLPLSLWPPSSAECNTFSQAQKRIPYSNEPNLSESLNNLVSCLVTIVGVLERADVDSD